MKTLLALLVLSLATLAPIPAAAPGTDRIDLGTSPLAIVRIPAGSFTMGTDKVVSGPQGWTNDVERPPHKVTISREFWMGEFPVTQAQWREVMGDNPSALKDAGPDAPVEQVSWNDTQSFLAKLNVSQGRWTVRLPTEAEWEYAARAGTTGETYGPLDDVAWYRSNGSSTTHPVGKKLPNAFGLYDMLGNVWQWCQDWFGPYTSAPAVDPQGEAKGEKRVMRGGCYYCDAIHCRAARRNRDPQEHLAKSIGFRVVAVARNPSR
jgi:formylglycine-generating enzyme required for sulfatase activity